MLRDILVALSVVVLMVICVETLPLVIPDPTIQAILGPTLAIGIVAAVLREREIFLCVTVSSTLFWLSHVLLGFIDPVPVVVIAGFFLRAWKYWSSPRPPASDAMTLDSPAANIET